MVETCKESTFFIIGSCEALKIRHFTKIFMFVRLFLFFNLYLSHLEWIWYLSGCILDFAFVWFNKKYRNIIFEKKKKNVDV